MGSNTASSSSNNSKKAMERELLELFDKAKRAAEIAQAESGSTKVEVQRCIDALGVLRTVPVTMGILVSTQVGKRLRALTKHPQEKIRAVASDIIAEWKKLVTSETLANNGNTDKLTNPIKTEGRSSGKITFSNDNGTKSSVLEDKLVKPIKVEGRTDKMGKGEPVKVEKKPKEELETANVKRPSLGSSSNGPPKLTSMIKCNDSFRDKFREILHDAFSKVPNEVEGKDLIRVNACDPVRVAVAVETAMFEKLGPSNGAQKLKYRSIMFNLKDANNPDLRRRVLLGDIKPDKLIGMSAEEMASDKRKQEIQQIKDKALFECERGQPKGATTDQFKCGKCGQRKCTYYQMQTRSADEPMTTYVTCVNCNNRWKFC